MKKIILTVLVGLLFTALASAQTDYAPTFTAGIKGGADLSSFPANSGFTNSSKIGYLGGFWGNLSLGVIDFQPEIYAIAKKVTVTYINAGNFYSEYSRYVTADIPLLFGGKFGDSKVAVRVYGGPVLSFALSKVQQFTNDNYDALRLNYKDLNYALQLGAGVNYHKFSLDVRYEAGLSKTGYGADINPVTGIQTSSTHLNIISLSIGYTLFSSYGDYTYQ
jgi:hypothetical protein